MRGKPAPPLHCLAALLAVLCLAGVTSPAAATYEPVGWWRMNEGSGAAVLDASGHANDGSLPNGASWATGVEGLALSLNGGTQYASVPSSTSLDITGPITLAAWVKTTKVGTQNVIAKALYGGSDGYELNLSSAGKPFLRLNGGYRLDGLTSYVANSWTHIAATYDGATMRVYVNGVLDASATTSLTIQSNALALGIGGQSDGASSRIFSGAIDDARVYDRALSASEIAELAGTGTTTYTITASAGANGAISPSGAVGVSAGADQAFAIAANPGYHVADVVVDGGSAGAVTGYTFTNVTAAHTIAASFALDGVTADLVGWWRLDGDATDASSYGNHGSLPDGGTWVGGVGNQALSLNGTSQYVSVPDHSSLDLASGLTLAAWIQPARLGTQPVIAKETYAGTPVWGYALELSGTSPGRPFFRLDGNTPGTTRLDGVTAYPQDGTTWMHLAATYDGATMRIYVNGLLDASLARSVAIPANALALAIGAQSTGESGRFFQGAIDDARVYSRALSAGEIAALMNHTITAGAAAHGSISPAGTVSVAHGTDQAFAITADPGYYVGDVLVDGTSVGPVAGYTFTNVTRSHAISASFTVDAPPAQPSLAGPASGATGVALAPTLDVVVTDPDSPELTVNFYGRAGNGPPGPDFTLVALPDAQYYTAQSGGAKNAMYKAQAQWCVSQLAARRIAYVAQLGDCVDDASVTVQWMRSDTVFRFLEDPVTTGLEDGIPYGIAVGNHEQYPKNSPDNSTVNYNLWFGESRFQDRGYYGGHFADNSDTWFHLFSASGMDFIVIGIEYDPTPDANRLSWADSLLKAHPDRRAIVVSHSIIGPGNPASWDGPGQTIYDALKTNPNLFLMLCGHVGDQGVKQSVYDGHTVYSLLSDYQGWTNGGDGYLRYMEFSPANDVIRVRTYSPWLGQYKVSADSVHQFTLPYDMSGTSAFQLIGTVAGVASGAHATIGWPGLTANTQYEWYVTVSDGASTTTSTPTWTFTTAGGGAPPDPVADLAVAPHPSGSGTGGTIKLQLGWTPPPQGGTAQVYRKAYGDYPLYRAGVGAVPALPATPAAAVAAGWTLTSVTAPGQSDQPAERGYWYYVVFTTGTGCTSGVSNRAEALGYLLGDVTNGYEAGTGDNQVQGIDVGLLGWHYGVVSPGGDYLGYLDVGPTSDGGLTSRPTPDGAIEFEDLIIFALNFGSGSSLVAQPPLATAAAGGDALALEVPELPAVGGEFTVVVRATAGGSLHALKLELGYDAAVVAMEGVEPGELLGRQGAQTVALTPKPGRVDVALLGAQAGLTGSGELVRVRFRVKGSGAAGLTLASAEGRDGANRKVALGGGAQVAPALPTATSFALPAPNPFSRTTTLSFALARGGAVELGVYGVDGRRVATLVRESREPGLYQVSWDGRDGSGRPVQPGMYYAQLVTPEGRFTRRLVLMR